MKVGISFNYAARTELGFGGSKTEHIKERMIELDLIDKPVYRWRLKEMNMQVTLHYKIHRTRKKQEQKNWLEFEVDISTIIGPDKSATEVINNMALTCDEIAAEIIGGYQFDGINAENIDTTNYDTEDTEDEATHPNAEYEWLIRNTSGTYTGKGSRRL